MKLPMHSRLVITGVSKRFGGLTAIQDVSLDTHDLGVVGIIGPNGAGKTTMFNLITGFAAVDAGSITLDGRDITNMAPDAIARSGVRRTFQNIRLFKGLPVVDNVATGGFHRRDLSLRSLRQRAIEVLHEVGYDARVDAPPGELPYAFQRRVEIARAMMGEPRVLLLDEPAAGMHERERSDLAVLIRHLHSMGIVVILIEHDMALISQVCDTVVVLDFGKVIASGSAATIRNDPSVIAAYLGAE
jgi:ABC-type branched-subunit amino acid transport system ATPase component